MYGSKWPFLLILFVCGPRVVVIKLLGQVVLWVELLGVSTRHPGFGASHLFSTLDKNQLALADSTKGQNICRESSTRVPTHGG